MSESKDCFECNYFIMEILQCQSKMLMLCKRVKLLASTIDEKKYAFNLLMTY